MTLKDRQKTILEAAIREHIKTARPVASQELLREFGFKVSPATVRSDMSVLDRLGYLEQPHTSAGRVPTDRGYRFFVDNLAGVSASEKKLKEEVRRIFEIPESDLFLKEMGKTVARLSGIFTAVGLDEGELIYETGLSELLDEPEFREKENTRSLGELVDMLGEEIRDIFEEVEGDEKILIGGENPWEKARSYSMFLSSWNHPSGFSGFLTMVGPRRTDYLKHKALMRSVRTYEL